MATITDVAKLAGVSHQTVSRVLNEEGTVRASTRARVEDAIQRLGYRPSAAARALATRKTGTIGLISTGSALYGPSSIMLGFNEAARQAGYQVSIASMAIAERSAMLAAVDRLLRQDVEALVLVAADRSSLEAIQGVTLGVPLITAESSGRTGLHSVSIDQFAGARMATAHLADLGHRSILHLAGPAGSLDAAERERGWRAELTQRGLPAADPLVGDWLAGSGYRCGRRLAATGGFSAIFCANDQMALGLLHAFTEAGISVPADVSIVGFDDIPESEHFTPPLTTVRQDFGELGRRIMVTLQEALAGRELGPSRTQPEFVFRQSTGPALGLDNSLREGSA
ncbi:LacI family DNA-binding transcriptional regulator [Parafrigoribacterium mesophilum]|uniref:LacI family DNA-binding transcriptional regulator n=1 Tax=Parafrigoribacterium mesophilum TaxID=433646 RepID=UPI0031FC7174